MSPSDGNKQSPAPQNRSQPAHATPDVLIIRKRSAYERHGSDLPAHRESHEALMRVVGSLTELVQKSGLEPQVLTIDELMDGRLAFFKSSLVDGASSSGGITPAHRLAIAVGGDGTLLHTSHYIGGSTQLLGINAVPRRSVGHLCFAQDTTFAAAIRRVLDGQVEPRRVARLEVVPADFERHDTINLGAGSAEVRHGRTQGTLHPHRFSALPLALNDVLFCNSHPAASSRYVLSVLHKSHEYPERWVQVCSESHISSGVWVATAAGSTAAISSYGLQRLPLESGRFLLAVREPYFRPESLSTMTRASFDGATQSVAIESSMSEAIVAVDGADFVVPLERGEVFWLRMLPSNGLLLYI